MNSFVHSDAKIYAICLIHPNGDVEPVTSYGLSDVVRAYRLKAEFAAMLRGVPTGSEHRPLVDAWWELVESGELPGRYRATLVEEGTWREVTEDDPELTRALLADLVRRLKSRGLAVRV